MPLGLMSEPSPRSADAEHSDTHLRLGVHEEKGEDEWRKIPHVTSEKQILTWDHAERGVSLGSACTCSSKRQKAVCVQ